MSQVRWPGNNSRTFSWMRDVRRRPRRWILGILLIVMGLLWAMNPTNESIEIVSMTFFESLPSSSSAVDVQQGPTTLDTVPRMPPLSQQHAPANNTTTDTIEIAIPRQFIFLDTRYRRLEDMPSHVYQNIQSTIRDYRDAWNHPSAPVLFFGDAECQAAMKRDDPLGNFMPYEDLLPFYLNETKGQNKANLCRLLAMAEVAAPLASALAQQVVINTVAEEVVFFSAMGVAAKAMLPPPLVGTQCIDYLP